MKRVTQLNHYEILNLEPSATKADIQCSYSRMWKTYQPGSLAVYSIISGHEREDMLARVEEAYKVLIDDTRRNEYDRSLGLGDFDVANKLRASESVFEPVRIPEEGSNSISEEATGKTDGEEKAEEEALDPLSQDFFKSYRNRKGISLREISEYTNISISLLSALEEGDYRRLPGRAYAIGFLREYAKYLELDYHKARQNMDAWARW